MDLVETTQAAAPIALARLSRQWEVMPASALLVRSPEGKISHLLELQKQLSSWVVQQNRFSTHAHRQTEEATAFYGAQLYKQKKSPIIIAGGRIDWRGSGPSESADKSDSYPDSGTDGSDFTRTIITQHL